MNNFRKISAILLVGLSTISAYGQYTENLVSNGSFEAIEGKIKGLKGIDIATGWTSPTGVPSDLFGPVKAKGSEISPANVPDNVYGKEDAKDGSNYAGIVAYSFGAKVPRSYILGKLDAPLKKGMRYCVKFNVSLAEASKYASNNIGISFTKKDPTTEDKTPIIADASILHPENDSKTFNKTYSWEQICGTFTAEGGEKFITIGNFMKDDKTRYENNLKPKDMKKTQIIAAYYYIDEVSVMLLEEDQFCDCLIAEERNEYSATIYQKAINLNDKMTVNQMIEAQQLFFAFGKDNLTPVGKESLDLIVSKMKANPALKLEIQGHSDTQEDKVGEEKPAYAKMDSKRVNAVILYLTENGITEARLIPSGQGSESPNEEAYESDDEDLKMAKNRRVTFKVR